MPEKTTTHRGLWRVLISLEIVAIALCLAWGAKTFHTWVESEARNRAANEQIETQGRKIAAALTRSDQAEVAKLVGSSETAAFLSAQTAGKKVTLPEKGVVNEVGSRYLVTFRTGQGKTISLRLSCTKNLACSGTIP